MKRIWCWIFGHRPLECGPNKNPVLWVDDFQIEACTRCGNVWGHYKAKDLTN
jgi:hypothetical protein